jgi:hypothetical protein
MCMCTTTIMNMNDVLTESSVSYVRIPITPESAIKNQKLDAFLKLLLSFRRDTDSVLIFNCQMGIPLNHISIIKKY